MLAAKYGAPVGSVLGPLLHIINVNDIVNCYDELRFVIQADDSNIYTVSHCLLRSVKNSCHGLRR